MTPKFIHDCDNCKIIDQDEKYDYYICEQTKPKLKEQMSYTKAKKFITHISYVARFGDAGPDYWSMDKDTLLKNIKDMIDNKSNSPGVHFYNKGLVK